MKHLKSSPGSKATQAHHKPLDGVLTVHGKLVGHDGLHSIVVTRPGATLEKPTNVPLSLLGAGHASQLQSFLLNNGYTEVANMTPKELSCAMREELRICKTHVIDAEGMHELVIADAQYRCFVKGGKHHWMGEKPVGFDVLLVGQAAASYQATKTIEEFNEEFGPVLQQSQRVLVTVAFTFSAYLFMIFGVAPVTLALIGRTSIGKSILQRFASWVVKGVGTLVKFNATEIGLHDLLSEQSRHPVFLEDAHGPGAASVLFRALMDLGNGAGRIRSRQGNAGGVAKPIECTVILSAERGLAETLGSGTACASSGVFARAFELHPAYHGMFESTCGFKNSAALAKHLNQAGPSYAGVLGDALLARIANDWPRPLKQWAKQQVKVRESILEAAGVEEVDGVNDRLLASLTFCAFVLGLAIKYEVLTTIKRSHVRAAFGALFKEHLDRLGKNITPIGASVVDEVRLYIQTHPAKFLPFAQAGDSSEPNGLAGYVKGSADDERVYLFFPGKFKDEFVKEFGSEVYDHLRTAGYLKAQKGRGNLCTVRLPAGGRVDFIAIRAAILFAADTE